MVWKELTEGLAEALRRTGFDPEDVLPRLELAIPREPAHGDWTTNLALQLAKSARRPPREVAAALAQAFPADPARFEPVEVAGPGFLNFRYSAPFLQALPGRIVSAASRFGESDVGAGARVLVEYVSANPTGPLNVVSARAAAVGSALLRLLQATGHRAAGEFYVNDSGRQVDLLGESLAARFAARIGVPRPFPEDGYQGEYLSDLAAVLPEAEARAALETQDGLAWFRTQALERMVAGQKAELEAYGAEFETWSRESELHRRGAVDAALVALRERGVVFEQDGATWLRTSAFGDDKDRVVVRSNGVPTYLLPDVAYHRDKKARGFDHAIDLWGPDHHAYVGTLSAALAALGHQGFLEILIVQQVNLLSAGEVVKMSKRAGEFVSLHDLMEDVGADCAKFFFLMRSTSAHLDFDLDLARRQNDENPAYYVQYAHARISSVLRLAETRGLTPDPGAAPRLEAPEEVALARTLAAFPEVVRGAALAREPHRVPAYLVETAAQFHRFYHACRVVGPDRAVSEGRVLLSAATRTVLKNGLRLLGVTAPERMERLEEATS